MFHNPFNSSTLYIQCSDRMTLQVVSEPKNYTFQLRMNNEIKAELERIFAKCGVTLSDAFNIFMQQALNVEGFPFPVVPDQGAMNLETALMYLTASYRKGIDSVKNEKDWIPADEVDRLLEE